MTEHVKTELSNGVLVVTLQRPDKKNAITGAMYSAWLCHPSASVQSSACMAICLLAWTANGPAAVTSAASSSAPANAWPGSVILLTSPSSANRVAGQDFPGKISSIARGYGMRLGRRKHPPPIATRDRAASGRPMVAVLEDTIRSHDKHSSRPPASA